MLLEKEIFESTKLQFMNIIMNIKLMKNLNNKLN